MSLRAALGRPRSGYTLLELLVVLAVLGVLSSLVMPLAELTVRREKERELKRALWEIRDAIDDYHRLHLVTGAAQGTAPYPPSLLALTQPLADPRPSHRGQVHRLLRRVPRDPFAAPTLAAEMSWGLRSSLSEAAQPQPGADVFDVYSTSSEMGLNGVPLRLW